jgi:hypothetical protein
LAELVDAILFLNLKNPQIKTAKAIIKRRIRKSPEVVLSVFIDIFIVAQKIPKLETRWNFEPGVL